MKVNNTLQYQICTKRCGVIHFISSFRLLLGCMKLTYYCNFQYGGYREPWENVSDVNIPEVSIGGSQHLQYSA